MMKWYEKKINLISKNRCFVFSCMFFNRLLQEKILGLG
jgi:hypothetical protein